jgi:hypothetical protein
LKARGEFALVRERLEGALDKPGQPVNFGTMAHDHVMYMMLTECAVEMRDEDALNKSAAQLMKLAQQDDHKLYTGIAARGLGVAQRMGGRLDESELSLEQALEIFSGLGARWQRGRTLMELAELQLERPRKRKASARQYYNEAVQMFEQMRAEPYLARAREAVEGLE